MTKSSLSYKDKLRANGFVREAIKRGALIRPTSCENCKKDCKPVAHHPDYKRPFYILWLCPKCHTRWHREHGFAETFDSPGTKNVRLEESVHQRLKLFSQQQKLTLDATVAFLLDKKS